MQSINSSNSSLTTFVPSENLAASAVLGLCFVLGVPGNIAVAVRLVGWLKGGSFTPRLMLSLAVSDLLTLLPLPVWICALLYQWIFDTLLCKVLSYMVYWSLYSSVLCVTLMSVQRYMQVLHPHKWAKLGAKGQRGLVGGTWILSGILGSYGPVQRNVNKGKDGRLHCSQNWNDTERVATMLWETIALFMLTFPILVFFYFRLHRRVNQSAFLNSQRVTVVVTRIVVVFFILWLPHHVINVVLVIAVLFRNGNLLGFAESASNIVGALVFVNSCVNPFLYAIPATAQQQHPQETETAR